MFKELYFNLTRFVVFRGITLDNIFQYNLEVNK